MSKIFGTIIHKTDKAPLWGELVATIDIPVKNQVITPIITVSNRGQVYNAFVLWNDTIKVYGYDKSNLTTLDERFTFYQSF